MSYVTSRDGTRIAYDRAGAGPPLILVGGSLEYRALDSETARLAAVPALARRFTVYHYDRRGRGDSGDTPPYAVAREVEDIEALIDEAGGVARLSGISSGAVLALEAAIALGHRVERLALYEPPYNDDQDKQALDGFGQRLNELVSAGRKDDALGLFMTFVGLPPERLDDMHKDPLWPQWEAVAHTLVYDFALVGDASVPVERAAGVSVPVLVLTGSESPPFIQTAAATLANALPRGRHEVLAGQTHAVEAGPLADALIAFFTTS